jgi:hypothetical protein
MTSVGVSRIILRINSPNKPDQAHPMINLVTQKGCSLHVPLSITYLGGAAESSNSTKEVSAKIFPISWPHPLASAQRLPSYQVLNMQAEYIKTGKYDKNLLYDTAQLVSFPGMKLDDGYATVQLYENKEKTLNMRITIPGDFPDDLLNKPVFVEIHSNVEYPSSDASLTLGMIVRG